MKYVKMSIKQNMKLENWISLLCFCIIIIFSLQYISDAKSIRIIGDEFGYWTAGAYFSGLHWEPAASLNAYYSYGYGLFLALILKIDIPKDYYYTAAVVLNCIFLCGTYILVRIFIERTFDNIGKNICSLLALCVTVYPANLIYAQFSMAEVLILLLFWVIINVSIELLNKPTFCKGVLFIFIVTFLYFVHQRTLGIYLSSFFILLYVLYNNRKNHILLLWIPLVFGCFLLGNYIKDIYQDSYLSGDNNLLLSINDYSGQIGKLKVLLSLSGVKQLIISILGKMFYAANSTFLLAGVGVISCLIQIWNDIKNKKLSTNTVMCMFFLMASVSMIGICSIYMQDFTSRMDLLFYGRYFEFTLMPLFLYGFIYLLNNYKNYKIVGVAIFIFILISIITCTKAQFKGVDTHLFLNVTSLADFYYITNNIVEFWFFNIARAIVLFLVAFWILNLNSSKKVIYILTIFIVAFIINYEIVYLKGCRGWSVAAMTANIELSEYIQDNNLQDNLYYYSGDDTTFSNSSYLQFLLPDTTIPYISELNEIDKLEASDILLTKRGTQIKEWLNNRYSLLAASTMLQLWGREGTVILSQDIGKEVVIDQQSLIFANGEEESYLVYGPYITLQSGTYEVSYSVEVPTNREGYGFCDISGNNGEIILGQNVFSFNQFQDKETTITIPFSLSEKTNNIEFRVCDYGQNAIKVKEISYKKIDSNYQLGMNSPFDIDKLKELLMYDNSIKSISCLVEEDYEISIKYLEDIFVDYQIDSHSYTEIVGNLTPKYVIVPSGNNDWLLLLDSYEVLANFKEFKLMVSSSSSLLPEIKLTNGRITSPELWRTINRDGFYTDKLSMPPGKYDFYLELLEPKDQSEQLGVEIYCNADLLSVLEVENKQFITIPIESNEQMDDFKIKIYDSNNSLKYRISGVKVAEHYLEYFYNNELELLIKKQDQFNCNSIIITDANMKNKSSIKKILTLYSLNNIQVKDYFFDLDNWEEDINNESCVILPNNLKLIYPMLGKNYIVVDAGPKYALLYRGDLTIKNPLSVGKMITKNYFSFSNRQSKKEGKIALPEGVFYITVNVDFLDEKNIDDFGGILNFYDGTELLYSEEIENKKAINILLSKQDGIQNLIMEVIEKKPNIIYAEIDGIEKISDGYLINLHDMKATGTSRYDETNRFVIQDADNVTIFGPYCKMEAGNYEIQFKYNVAEGIPLVFDVCANSGNTIFYKEESWNSKETNLMITLTSDVKDAEFRIYVPAGELFTLESILVIPSTPSED